MRICFQFFLSTLIILLLNTQISAQGCSDAGFCTAGSHFNEFEEESDSSNKSHWFRFTPGISVGEEGIIHFTPTAEIRYEFKPAFGLQIRIPWQANFGDIDNSFCMGNFTILGNSRVFKKNIVSLFLNYGFSISPNTANKKSDGRALPMAYQSNLGTWDGIFTVHLKVKGFNFTTGIQQPIVQYNNNAFFPNNFIGNAEDFELANAFHPTNNFRRSGDFMIRSDYNINIKDKVFLTPGLLFIYHLKNDQYTDINGIEREIEGSQGTTLNITGGLSWIISKQFSIGANAGFPIIVRDERPDGLTRSLVVSPYFQFNF